MNAIEALQAVRSLVALGVTSLLPVRGCQYRSCCNLLSWLSLQKCDAAAESQRQSFEAEIRALTSRLHNVSEDMTNQLSKDRVCGWAFPPPPYSFRQSSPALAPHLSAAMMYQEPA